MRAAGGTGDHDVQNRFTLPELIAAAETRMTERAEAMRISEVEVEKCKRCIGQAYRATLFASIRVTGGATELAKILQTTCQLNSITEVQGNPIGSCTTQDLYKSLCEQVN